MTRRVVPILLAAALTMPEAARAEVAVQERQALSVIECAEFVGTPVDLEGHHGHIYLLDEAERCIWEFDADGRRVGGIGIKDGRKKVEHAGDLMFFCDGRMAVTDIERSGVFVGEPGGKEWRFMALDYRPFFGAGHHDGFAVNARRYAGEHLVNRWDCGLERWSLGDRIIHEHEFQSVANNLNHVKIALSDDVVVVGHVALARVQIYWPDGRKRTEFTIQGPEVQEARRWFLDLADDAPDATTHAQFVADLVSLAAPSRFAIPVYIGDIEVFEGRIYLLVAGAILGYDLDGRLERRIAITGAMDRELVFIHGFTIAADGELLGFDRAHFKKIYRFGSIRD